MIHGILLAVRFLLRLEFAFVIKQNGLYWHWAISGHFEQMVSFMMHVIHQLIIHREVSGKYVCSNEVRAVKQGQVIIWRDMIFLFILFLQTSDSRRSVEYVQVDTCIYSFSNFPLAFIFF